MSEKRVSIDSQIELFPFEALATFDRLSSQSSVSLGLRALYFKSDLLKRQKISTFLSAFLAAKSALPRHASTAAEFGSRCSPRCHRSRQWQAAKKKKCINCDLELLSNVSKSEKWMRDLRSDVIERARAKERSEKGKTVHARLEAFVRLRSPVTLATIRCCWQIHFLLNAYLFILQHPRIPIQLRCRGMAETVRYSGSLSLSRPNTYRVKLNCGIQMSIFQLSIVQMYGCIDVYNCMQL